VSARAAIKTGDLNRYLKAAKAHGFAVEIDGDRVRLLPTDQPVPVTSAKPAEDEDAWDKALGLQ
jgi:hypothetical protein